MANGRTCPCEVACNERDFQSTVSTSTWPSNQVNLSCSKNISSINCCQYWQLFALDVGTYSEEEINEGGPKGQEIKPEIQQDFAKYFISSMITKLTFYSRVNIYYQTLNIQSILEAPQFDVSSPIH